MCRRIVRYFLRGTLHSNRCWKQWCFVRKQVPSQSTIFTPASFFARISKSSNTMTRLFSMSYSGHTLAFPPGDCSAARDRSPPKLNAASSARVRNPAGNNSVISNSFSPLIGFLSAQRRIGPAFTYIGIYSLFDATPSRFCLKIRVCF